MKEIASHVAARGEVRQLSVLIRCADADDPGRNRIRIQSVLSRPGVACGEDDVDAFVRQYLRGDVHRVVDVEDGVGGEAAIDDARVEASAIAQEIIETR